MGKQLRKTQLSTSGFYTQIYTHIHMHSHTHVHTHTYNMQARLNHLNPKSPHNLSSMPPGHTHKGLNFTADKKQALISEVQCCL